MVADRGSGRLVLFDTQKANDMMPTQTSVAQFFDWLRASMPGLYSEIQRRGGALVAIDFGAILSNVKDLGAQYLQYDAQRRLLNAQLDRARAGLPPLDAGQYAPGINAGIATDTRNDITMWLLIGGAALIAVMMLRR